MDQNLPLDVFQEHIDIVNQQLNLLENMQLPPHCIDLFQQQKKSLAICQEFCQIRKNHLQALLQLQAGVPQY